MILGVGLDIVELSEFADSVISHPGMMRRVFTTRELTDCDRRDKVDRLAARFAAKEAALKAVGTGWRRGITWHDAEVISRRGVRPTLAVRGGLLRRARALGGETFHLTLTHSGAYAAAVVLLVAP